TGNSLQVARDLASELGEVTQIVPIARVISDKEIAPEAERIGIIYPVYMWGMPLIVSEFIKKFKANKTAYVFAIATYGGISGAALTQTAKELSAQGIKLAGGFAVLMPGNYTPLYGAIPEEKQRSMFSQEKKRIKEIAAIVRAAKETAIDKSFFLVSALLSGFVYKMGSAKIPQMDESFWVNEQCTHCGLCQRVCPVHNITIEEGKPVWHNRCEQCMACLQWCPVEAIQSGRSTSGRKRYKHPQTKVEDFMNITTQ
ncbi:MAG: EFR1 family ferrodoxin, partial [Candidatus Omnitrophota bacterium]